MAEQGDLFAVGPRFDEIRRKFTDELQQEGHALCPCCGTERRVWKRSIHSLMAHDLIWLYRHHYRYPHDNYVRHSEHKVDPHGREEGLRASDFAYLRHWLLIASAGEEHPRYPSTGYWKLTQRGCLFVRGEISVMKYCVDYYQRILRFEGPSVFIQDCLGEKFDYQELMGAALATGAGGVVEEALAP